MVDHNLVPYCNRETRRKVEKYRRKHSNLTFTEAYNKLYGTKYSEPTHFADTSLPQDFQQQTEALVKRINEELKEVTK